MGFHSCTAATAAAVAFIMSSLLCMPTCDPWQPDSINVYAGEGNDSIDILPFLTQPERIDPYSCLRGSRHPKKVMCIFPPELYPPSWGERRVLESAIKRAAQEKGIKLISRSTDKQADDENRNVARMECDLKQQYRPKKGKANDISLNVFKDMKHSEEANVVAGLKGDCFVNRQKECRDNPLKQNKTRLGFTGASAGRTTKLPNGMRCTCHMRLILIPGKHWLIRPNTGFSQHTCSRLPPEERIARPATLTEEQRRNAGAVASHSSTSQAQLALHDMMKENFTATQVNSMKQSHDATMGHVLPLVMEDGRNKSELSGAEQLIRKLEKDQKEGKKSFIAIYHCVTDTSLHTVRATDLQRDKKRCRADAEADADQLTSNSDALPNVVADGKVEMDPSMDNRCAMTIDIESTNEHGMTTRGKAKLNEAEKIQLATMLKPIHARMRVGQKILLAVAWARADEKRLFELHPEVFMIDVTFGTNCEGRPLGMTAAVDSNMHSFTPLRAFLPSECRWVFRWLWEEAILTLLGKETLNRVQLVLSDGDSKIYVPFDDAQKKGLYRNAVHGLCQYHLVTQKLHDLKLKDLEKDDVVAMIQT